MISVNQDSLFKKAYRFFLKLKYPEYQVKYPMLSTSMLFIKLEHDWVHIVNKRSFLMTIHEDHLKDLKQKKEMIPMKKNVMMMIRLRKKIRIRKTGKMKTGISAFYQYFIEQKETYLNMGYERKVLMRIMQEHWKTLDKELKEEYKIKARQYNH